MTVEYKNEQDVCPKCGGCNLTYGALNVEEDYMCWYPYTCRDCGQQGEEWYTMTFNGHNVLTEDGEWVEL